jgi:hypothetical protein
MNYFIFRRHVAKVIIGVATGWTARVRLPAVQDFSLLHIVQIGSGAHPASYPMGTGGSFPGNTAAGRDDGYLPPLSAMVKNSRAKSPLPHVCLHGIVLY